jgi:hypothetical protein
MRFEGDYTDKVLPKLGKVTRGITQNRSYLSEFNNVPVMVKPATRTEVQVLIDELKPLFGLEKMGVSYNERYLFIKISPVKGSLWQTTGWEQNQDIIDELTRVHIFRWTVMSRDLVLSNVMWLNNNRVLSIDEVAGFEDYDIPIKNKVKKLRPTVWTLSQMSFQRNKAEIFSWLENIDRQKAKTLFLRYGFVRQYENFDQALTNRRGLELYFENGVHNGMDKREDRSVCKV